MNLGLQGTSVLRGLFSGHVGGGRPGGYYHDGVAFDDGRQPGVCRRGDDRQYPEGRLLPDPLVPGGYLRYSGFDEKGQEADE